MPDIKRGHFVRKAFIYIFTLIQNGSPSFSGRGGGTTKCYGSGCYEMYWYERVFGSKSYKKSDLLFLVVKLSWKLYV